MSNRFYVNDVQIFGNNEMFKNTYIELEKKAEEILSKHCNCEFLSECIEGVRIRCSDFEEKKKLLLEGIEFGYKKANEWHHTSKGEYPQECENVLCYCKGCGIKFYCVGNIIMGRWWATNKSEELRVIAWKEIVPPKFVVEE